MKPQGSFPFFTASGVYEIRCTVTQECYIGFSNNVWKRWTRHLAMLRQGKHYASLLQAAWLRYGESTFEFTIIEKMPPHPDYAMRLAEARHMRERLPAYNGAEALHRYAI
jgi:group I intron endonuclease